MNPASLQDLAFDPDLALGLGLGSTSNPAPHAANEMVTDALVGERTGGRTDVLTDALAGVPGPHQVPVLYSRPVLPVASAAGLPSQVLADEAVESAPPTVTCPPVARTAGLDALLRHPGLWRPGDGTRPGMPVEATGYPVLDRLLPGGGWPRGALTEIVVAQQGIGELALLLPALARLARQGRSVVWVAPPYVPYAPALEQGGLELPEMLWLCSSNGIEVEERLWAAEQALRSGVCGAVLLWMSVGDAARVNIRALRRLQLAAEQGNALGVVFWRRAPATSSAALKIRVSAPGDGAGRQSLLLEVLKCRGLGESGPIEVVLGSTVC